MRLQSVRLIGIGKRFGRKSVLDKIDLDIEPGEFLVLLGPSGCGKSTLLNIVAGLDYANEGRVIIGDQEVTELEPGQRNVAMVFQSYALYPAMSARRNIGFALAVNGTPASEVRYKVKEVAKLLQIEDLLDRKPAQLSGGQQQRVAIGRALVRDPAVLLLDEPLSNLDAKLRMDMRMELKRLKGKSPRTTLYVTHDQTEAMALASRVAVLSNGRILQCDRPEVVYSRPKSQFVASFVGTPAMRFVKGTLRTIGGTPSLETAAGKMLPLPGLAPRGVQAGQTLVVGMRSEDVHIVPAGTESSVMGQCIFTESTGPDVYAMIVLNGHEIMARATHRCSLQPQEEIPVRIDGAAVNLFSAMNGERLN